LSTPITPTEKFLGFERAERRPEFLIDAFSGPVTKAC
jgi:hypothetical protein